MGMLPTCLVTDDGFRTVAYPGLGLSCALVGSVLHRRKNWSRSNPLRTPDRPVERARNAGPVPVLAWPAGAADVPISPGDVARRPAQ